MRISDWSSDVCSSDLFTGLLLVSHNAHLVASIRGAVQAEDLDRDSRTGFLDRLAVLVEHGAHARSEERRAGKECVSMCRSRWSPYHYKKNFILLFLTPFISFSFLSFFLFFSFF